MSSCGIHFCFRIQHQDNSFPIPTQKFRNPPSLLHVTGNRISLAVGQSRWCHLTEFIYRKTYFRLVSTVNLFKFDLMRQVMLLLSYHQQTYGPTKHHKHHGMHFKNVCINRTLVFLTCYPARVRSEVRWRGGIIWTCRSKYGHCNL